MADQVLKVIELKRDDYRSDAPARDLQRIQRVVDSLAALDSETTGNSGDLSKPVTVFANINDLRVVVQAIEPYVVPVFGCGYTATGQVSPSAISKAFADLRDQILGHGPDSPNRLVVLGRDGKPQARIVFTP